MESEKTRLEINNNYFIQLLNDHIFSRPSFDGSVPQDIVFLAKSHQVSPIVHYQTKNKLLLQAYLQAVSSFTRRENLLLQIEESLRDIPFYTVKGISVARYYPVPQLRTMGDCDIIVHESDKEKARDVFLSIGFEEHTSEWDSAEWHFQKQGLDFELHHRLLMMKL